MYVYERIIGNWQSAREPIIMASSAALMSLLIKWYIKNNNSSSTSIKLMSTCLFSLDINKLKKTRLIIRTWVIVYVKHINHTTNYKLNMCVTNGNSNWLEKKRCEGPGTLG